MINVATDTAFSGWYKACSAKLALLAFIIKEVYQIRIQFCLIKNGYCGKAMLRQRKKESRFKA